MASEVKNCVVCGAGSHREDWQRNPNPACDSHKPQEVQAAIAAKKQNGPQLVPATPSAQPPAAPPAAVTK
jgi:hypothetical protein